MNIFILDERPVEAAQMQCDKHVVKMILESAQMLCTSHRFLDGKMEIRKSKNNRNIKTWVLTDERENIMYKSAHVNHPCTIWTRACAHNYNWLLKHFDALCSEFVFRFGKRHKSDSLLQILSNMPENISYNNTNSEFAVAISEDIYPGIKNEKRPIQSYRNYYVEKNKKQFEMKWTKRPKPEWML
jgi:hypothetical protein